MRINYAPSTPPTTNPDGTPLSETEQKATAEVYERVTARRKPRPLIPLDLALLHSPPIADGYNSLLGAIRNQAVIPQDVLELSVCRVAILNGAVYEWNAHAPLALKAGVTAEQLQGVKSIPISTFTPEGKIINNTRKPAESSLTDFQWEVLLFTDAMTKNIKVDDTIFGAIKSRFGEREVVELTVCIGAYNMVSRFLVTLDVGENNDKKMKDAVDIAAELEDVDGKAQGR
ncbi:4-carboxymuconolactone decarboxylase family protein [Talaromyces stipitatus ATCC 10500]|uniref:4-carboxymuconolactone decarboxylase family protein n=1 Tax=Talaromyces stipitatus (strain ATCC 10500 / CBS 375.48 / QM 6759 / NRRL 1006) TaxID=441959 RepID=B8MT80_TALSN|nr:4-carboxymuconolactone decarboxylase family protein [Talaromyces stipitatus ATCC 10500]EED12177.1 4-carboxymuconolactone decarboxylase family protein [Talaromyces stipitatus ATCC 10500]